MSNFETSTQKTFWIFSLDEIREKRSKAVANACSTLKKLSPIEKPEKPAGSPMEIATPSKAASPMVISNTPLTKKRTHEEISTPPTSSVNKVQYEPLTLEEDQILQLNYARQIVNICTQLKYDKRVMMTALVFFKRFYLSCTCMDENPKYMFLTAIYVAAKVEEAPLSLEDRGINVEQLAKSCQVSVDDIRQNEFTLLDNLNYHMVVFHPLRPIRGFISSFASCFNLEDNDDLQQIKDDAEGMIAVALLNDVGFLTTPSRLAICLILLSIESVASNVVTIEMFKEFLCKEFNYNADQVNQLIVELTSLKQLVKDGNMSIPLDKTLLKKANKKLKKLLIPINEIKLKQKQEQKQKHEAQRQLKYQRQLEEQTNASKTALGHS